MYFEVCLKQSEKGRIYVHLKASADTESQNKECENSSQNMESETTIENMESFSQNMETESDDQNMENGRDDQNMEKEGEDQNMENEKDDQNMENERDDQNMENEKDDQNMENERDDQNMENERDDQNMENERDDQNLERERGSHTQNTEGGNGGQNIESGNHTHSTDDGSSIQNVERNSKKLKIHEDLIKVIFEKENGGDSDWPLTHCKDLVDKFKELYPHKDINLLHCILAHYDQGDTFLYLKREKNTRFCTHQEYHPIITALSNGDGLMVEDLMSTHNYDHHMRKWKGAIDYDDDCMKEEPRTVLDIILERDSLDLLKIVLKHYKRHLYPILKIAEQNYPKAKECHGALVKLMEDYQQMRIADENKISPDSKLMVWRNTWKGCWKSNILNHIIFDVIHAACYSDGLNCSFLKDSALCMLKDGGHTYPEDTCPECERLINSQSGKSRNQNTESGTTHQNSTSESKTQSASDWYSSLNHHQQTIRHLCRAALLTLKETNVNEENIDVIKHGIFCQHEYLFLDIVEYVCKRSVDRLDFAAINEALLTRTMMTQMFLEYGVEDDRVIEELGRHHMKGMKGITLTQKIFCKLHFWMWPPQEIESSENKEHQKTMTLVQRHLETLVAFGFSDPNTVHELLDICSDFVGLLRTRRPYYYVATAHLLEEELGEEKGKENKDEDKIQQLEWTLKKQYICATASPSLKEKCRAKMHMIMKKEKKSLPAEVASLDLSPEQKSYMTLGVQPFFSDTQRAMKSESSKQNMESESSKQNVESESNKQNMESESSKQNMESRSSKQNMGSESSKQNMESESSKQNMESKSSKQNMESESSKQNVESESSKQNMEGESNSQNRESESSTRTRRVMISIANRTWKVKGQQEQEK